MSRLDLMSLETGQQRTGGHSNKRCPVPAEPRRESSSLITAPGNKGTRLSDPRPFMCLSWQATSCAVLGGVLLQLQGADAVPLEHMICYCCELFWHGRLSACG